MDAGTIYTDKKTKKLENKLLAVYSEAEKDLQKKMDAFTQKYKQKLAIHEQELKDGKITQTQFDAWIRGQVFQGKQWQAKQQQVLETMYNANVVAAGMINGDAQNVFAANANFMSYTLEHTAGVNFGFGLYDGNTVAKLIKNDPKLLPEWKINEPKDYVWNQKKLNNAVTQGIIQGESLDQITKRIATGLAMQNYNASLTFARTAMTGAQNAGRDTSLINAKAKGINVVKQWMSTLDGRTRDSHRHMDGETLVVKDKRHPVKFSNGCRYPGDPDGPPQEVYNCRCTLVGDLVDYPAEYERRDNINGEVIRGMSYTEWEKARKAEQQTGIHTILPIPQKFKQAFDAAKASLPAGGEWRVDDTYTVADYEHKRLYELDGGSVVAIAEDGDIVSVCKRQWSDKDLEDHGSDLLKVAVANGGDRLDAFGDGLYKFYTKNGFEPVSWTPFDEEYAPHDWVKGRDNPEPVIFYKYTGRRTDLSYADFLQTPASDDYGIAKEVRNQSITHK